MKPSNKRSSIFSMFWVSAAVLAFSACTIDPIPDPNNPSAGEITKNASLGEIQNLVTGIESGMRENLGGYLDDVGVIGREFYRFSSSDPRFTSDLLGKGSATLDNNTFYTTNPFEARYRVVKNANILIEALQNTKATMSEDQRKAGIAYAKTIKAHELLMVFNLQYSNGIRVDVADPDNLGPFLDKDASLAAIQTLLDEANTDLKSSGAVFPFTTTLWSSNIAGEFSKLNRALAARVAVYKKEWAQALTALSESFYSLTGDLKTGSYYLFSTAGGDALTALYYPQNSSGETRVAQPSFITDAAPGDTRLSKVSKRDQNAFVDGLSSDYDVWVYKTNTDPMPIIRNEELILIYAEAQAQSNNSTEAIKAIDRVRTAAGLVNYSGATDAASLINEILVQRRYSLYAEGHRWIDMRRYDRLGQLPIDRTGDDVWVEFPRPATEN
jgi:starch-binding outer membrane protein, SusD/RagB family